MTTKEQRQDFIDRVRESATSLFVPRPLVSGDSAVLPIHQVWLDSLRADVIGQGTATEYFSGERELQFTYGATSWTAIATNMEVFDDEACRPEGVEKGQGYTDGKTLFVPLSKLKEIVLEENHQVSLNWLNNGLLRHASHLLEVPLPSGEGSQEWVAAHDGVDFASKAAMQFAFSRAKGFSGRWLTINEAFQSHTDPSLLAAESGSGILRLIDAIIIASQKSETSLSDGPWRKPDASSKKIVGSLPKYSDVYGEIGTWFMDTCKACGVSWSEFPLAVQVAQFMLLRKYGEATSFSFNDSLFVKAIQAHPGASPALVASASAALKHAGFVSPLYPNDTESRAKYMHAQAHLLDKNVSPKDLAEAILNVQDMAPSRVPEPGMMSYAEVMNSLFGLTKGSGMSEEMLIQCAKHAPSVAILWARRNTSKVIYGESLFVRRLADGLVRNRMEHSGAERVSIVQEYLNNGNLYKNVQSEKPAHPSKGFHHVLKSPEPWAAEAMTNALKASTSEAPIVLLYKRFPGGIDGNLRADENVHNLPEILFNAGLTPTSKVFNPQTRNEVEIRTLSGDNLIDAAYADYQAKALTTNTAPPQISSSVGIRL